MICFYLSFQAECPTVLCSGRRWRGPGAGRDRGASWRASARAGRWRSPAAPLKAGVGPLQVESPDWVRRKVSGNGPGGPAERLRRLGACRPNATTLQRLSGFPKTYAAPALIHWLDS